LEGNVPLGGVIFLIVFIGLFGTFLIYLARFTGGRRPASKAKSDPYECGIPGQDKKDTKVSVKFYLTAILFILFDIEIIFMYPWAITFRDFIASGNGLGVLIGVTIFLLVFIFGLFWEIKSKALEWD
jgi:NADH-quinone oxidoreductase subunit A